MKKHLGEARIDEKATSYLPVVAMFSITALMALAASHTASGFVHTVHAGEWFIAFSMCFLALKKTP